MLHGSIVNCQNTFEVNVYSLLTLSSSPHRHTWTVSLIDLIESFRRFHNGPQSLSEALHESMACDPLAPILWEPHMQALNRRLGIVLESLRDCIEHNSADDVIYPKWKKKNAGRSTDVLFASRTFMNVCACVHARNFFFYEINVNAILKHHININSSPNCDRHSHCVSCMAPNDTQKKQYHAAFMCLQGRPFICTDALFADMETDWDGDNNKIYNFLVYIL